MSEIKRCGACQQVKLKTEFHRHPQNRDGRQPYCKSCESEATTRRRHGLSRVEKADLAAAQGGCAICGTTDPGVNGWVVDHDHRCCGPVRSCDQCCRGILCGRCNTALGMARDDSDLLRRMADYLDAHRMSESHNRSQERVALANPYGRTDGLTEKLVTYQRIMQLPYRARAAHAVAKRMTSTGQETSR